MRLNVITDNFPFDSIFLGGVRLQAAERSKTGDALKYDGHRQAFEFAVILTKSAIFSEVRVCHQRYAIRTLSVDHFPTTSGRHESPLQA